MTGQEVIDAWDQAGPAHIHPSRGVSEEAYWASGEQAALQLAEVLKPGSRVVDFGCGDGRVAIPLKRLGFDVTGADASPKMLAHLAENDPDMPQVLSDGSDLYEQIGHKVDAVVCLAVLIHHPRSSALAILDGLVKAVRKGGLIVVDWPTSDNPEEAQIWIDVTTWHPDAQKAEAEKRGLKRIEPERPWAVFRKT
ncbi:class I SAM-dependent methyltransferase [Streptosporangium sp. NPDC050855]|uniref:class I SAM-dependent methyltransferase n=1 Tax=Streptosporangium sp. NPDC050855 TaxID=3366194 RepID=UPI0037BC349E